MTSAIALLVVMSIRTTNITKPLKRLLVPLLLSKNPFLKVKSFIIVCILIFSPQKYYFIIKPTRFCGKNQNIMISFSFGLHISSYFVKIHIEMSKIYKFLSTFIIFFLPLQTTMCSFLRK